MRAALPLLAATTLLTLPAFAEASPFEVATIVQEPAAGGGAEPAADPGAASTEAPAMEPPAEEAPAADPTEAPAEEPAADPTAEGPDEEPGPADPTEEGDPEELDSVDEEGLAGGDPGQPNIHGIGVRGGITVVPTWILSGFLASHSNALCRKEVGNFGADRGLTKTQGCNFFIGGEYTYRRSKVFDIVAAAGYQRMKTPDGLWLDADEVDANGNPDLSAADYTEVDLSFVFIEADFIARAPVLKTPDIEIGIGGGGGIGLGIIVGSGVFQTPLGPVAPGSGTCNSIDDFSDFTKCTPAWFDDDDIDQNGDGDPNDPAPPYGDDTPLENFPFATCSADECSESDLNRFGSRVKNGDVPPVIPVVNLILSTRFIIKDTFAIDIRGGFNTGFYFGSSLGYFFGSGSKKSKK